MFYVMYVLMYRNKRRYCKSTHWLTRRHWSVIFLGKLVRHTLFDIVFVNMAELTLSCQVHWTYNCKTVCTISIHLGSHGNRTTHGFIKQNQENLWYTKYILYILKVYFAHYKIIRFVKYTPLSNTDLLFHCLVALQI